MRMNNEELKERLEEAEELLSRARGAMDAVHLYDTELYREIGIFLNGEEE